MSDIEIDNDIIELSKQESLDLNTAYSTYLMSKADFEDMVEKVFLRYSINKSDYNIDIRNGRLVKNKDGKPS